jgi:hypothetical protein
LLKFPDFKALMTLFLLGPTDSNPAISDITLDVKFKFSPPDITLRLPSGVFCSSFVIPCIVLLSKSFNGAFLLTLPKLLNISLTA